MKYPTFLSALALPAIFVLASGLTAFSGKEGNPKLPKLFKKEYVEMPAGTCVLDGESHALEAFYLCRHEVTNAEYLEFWYHTEKDRPELLPVIAVDTAGWTRSGMGVFSDLYHRHVAYYEYPVLNISHEAAVAYCEWLTEFNNEKGLFADVPGYKVTYRLPTRAEWVYAAKGAGSADRIYAWEGNRVRNTKGTYNGNFRLPPEHLMRYDAEKNEYIVMPPENINTPCDSVVKQEVVGVTAPVISFEASSSGLYNMNGNVAEMLAEPGVAAGGSWWHSAYDVRNESLMEYTEPSPYTGFRVLAVVTKE